MVDICVSNKTDEKQNFNDNRVK